LGDLSEAERLIEKAVALGGDADAWYCRAQIGLRGQPARSLSDLKAWRDAVEQQRMATGELSKEKRALLARVRAALNAVAAGEVTVEHLFDVDNQEVAAATPGRARSLRRVLF